MEEMKIRFCLILPLLFILSLCSCASSPAVENGTASGVQDVHKEKKQNHKKLLFEDWKYKGFGQALPDWFEAAYSANEAGIKKTEQKLSDCEIVIIRGEGINSDQAERVMDLHKADIPEDFTLFDSYWAMKSNGTYVSIAIYTKE